jgi:hypothetical protein
MPKNTPPESHLTRRNDHQLGIIRGSAYSTLCRHSVERFTYGSVGAGGCDSLRPPDLLKGLRYVPRVLVTDKLGSYRVAHRELMSSVEHRQSKYLLIHTEFAGARPSPR